MQKPGIPNSDVKYVVPLSPAELPPAKKRPRPSIDRRFLGWVIFPETLGPTKADARELGTLYRRAGRVRRRTQQQIEALWEVGSNIFDGQKGRMGAMLQCMPLVPRSKRRGTWRTCKRSRFCPACWAREARRSWRKIKPRLPPLAGYLVVTRLQSYQPMTKSELNTAIEAAIKSRGRAWDRACYSLGARDGGMYEALRVLPAPKARFELEVRRVYLVRAEAYRARGVTRRPDGFKEIDVTDASWTTLAQGLAWVWRYPGYLLREAPATVDLVINASRPKPGRTIRAGFGLFHGCHGKPAGALLQRARAASCTSPEIPDVPQDSNGATSMAQEPETHPENIVAALPASPP